MATPLHTIKRNLSVLTRFRPLTLIGQNELPAQCGLLLLKTLASTSLGDAF